MARARVTYTWNNGNAVVEHHDWHDEWDFTGVFRPDQNPAFSYLESTQQVDYSVVREMETKHEHLSLVFVRVERVDG